MSIKNSSRSTKAALLIASMAATFLVVFVVTLLTGNALRKDSATQPPVIINDTHPTETTPPTTKSPTTSSPTKLAESNTETPPPTTALPTTSSPTNTQIKCPLPTTDSYGSMGWTQLGQVIEGDNKDYTIDVQPVAMFKTDFSDFTTESPTETPPPTTESPTTIPPTNAQMECPLPTADSYGSMSNDGNRVVIGNPWCSDDRIVFGNSWEDFKVYLVPGPATVKAFDFTGKTWDEAGSFTGRNEDKFGQHISLSGDGKRLAISAIWADTGVGHVETYDFIEGTNWMSVGQMLTGINTNDLFGYSISLSNDGSRMAIGAVHTEVNGENSGSVRVYELEGDTWKQLGDTIHGEAADDQFGIAVSISKDGSIVAVGAWYSDENSSESGSVRVFRYSLKRRTTQETQAKRNTQSSQETGTWVQVGQKLLGEASDDWFGRSLSINKNGDTLAVGAYGGNYVRVFHLVNNQWFQMGDTLIGENNFGYSVFLAPSANRLAVGTYDSNEGYVRMFDFDGNWMQIGNINSPSSEKYFRTSVSLSNCGNRLVIGSSSDTNGRLRVYEFD